MAVRDVDVGKRDQASPPFNGYRTREIPPPDPYLTQVGPGTPMGEFMRRFWQPVCLSEELTDLPKAIRILGEDLVAFRDKSGNVGVLHRHCSHRGTSLEYGIVSEQGIRCCYHGWLFDVGGTILETPGEPPDSKLKDSLYHGAYPAQEYKGIVHAYLGPPEMRPHFPEYDLFDVPGAKYAPFSFSYENNWLQSHENAVDPVHSVFLHQRITEHFVDPFSVLSHLTWQFTGDGSGLLYTAKRRVDEDTIWVRILHTLMPSSLFIPSTWDLGDAPLYYQRALYIRHLVPVDDENFTFFGWRVHGDEFPGGFPEKNRPGMIDMDGQTKRDIDYEEIQRAPDDWQAQGSQYGGIAVHQRDHLGSTDGGVAMMRRGLRNILDGNAPAAWPKPASEEPDGPKIRNVYAFDSLLQIKELPDSDADWEMMADLGKELTAAVIEIGDSLDDQAERDRQTRARTKEIELEYQARYKTN